MNMFDMVLGVATGDEAATEAFGKKSFGDKLAKSAMKAGKSIDHAVQKMSYDRATKAKSIREARAERKWRKKQEKEYAKLADMRKKSYEEGKKAGKVDAAMNILKLDKGYSIDPPKPEKKGLAQFLKK